MKVEVAPYWNVNFGNERKGSSNNIVEVAPYWNVNKGEKGEQGLTGAVEVALYDESIIDN